MNKKILILSILFIASNNIFGAIFGPGITVHNKSGKKVWVKADKQLDKRKQSFNKGAEVIGGYVSIEKDKQELIKTKSGDKAVQWKFEDKDVDTGKSFERGYTTKKIYKNPNYLTIIGDQGAYVMIERAFGKKDIKDELTEEEIRKEILKEKSNKIFEEEFNKIIEKIHTFNSENEILNAENEILNLIKIYDINPNYIIKSGKEPFKGEDILNIAAYHLFDKIVSQLIKTGANVNKIGISNSPLENALYGGEYFIRKENEFSIKSIDRLLKTIETIIKAGGKSSREKNNIDALRVMHIIAELKKGNEATAKELFKKLHKNSYEHRVAENILKLKLLVYSPNKPAKKIKKNKQPASMQDYVY